MAGKATGKTGGRWKYSNFSFDVPFGYGSVTSSPFSGKLSAATFSHALEEEEQKSANTKAAPKTGDLADTGMLLLCLTASMGMMGCIV